MNETPRELLQRMFDEHLRTMTLLEAQMRGVSKAIMREASKLEALQEAMVALEDDPRQAAGGMGEAERCYEILNERRLTVSNELLTTESMSLKQIERKLKQCVRGEAVNTRHGCTTDEPERAHHRRRRKYWSRQFTKWEDRYCRVHPLFKKP